MKESGCGRIVSQRKTQNSLIKQYDTKSTINYGRVNQLKKKYLKTDPRTPLMNLINNNQNQSTQISDFTNQVRQKFLINQQQRINFQEIKKNRNKDVNQFRKKAQLTNITINDKLNSIQEELNQWKNRQLKAIKQSKDKKQVKIQYDIRLPESIKVSKVEQQIENNLIQQKINARLTKQNYLIQQSSCKLLGQFKKPTNISNQFITFINRLKDQLSLDIDFTQILLSLPVKDLQTVRSYLKRNYPSVDLQFFTISPIQHDPLQPQAKVKIVGNIEKIARKLHQFYNKIQQHYKLKLFKNYELETIETLFQEIGQSQITLGHLISYINMRTGKQFRNRGLVKLLKRLGISSHFIDKKSFKLGFVKN